MAEGNYQTEPSYIRAYVKDLKDGPYVQEFLDGHYSGATIHVLQADICREELVVEIEAEFRVRNK